MIRLLPFILVPILIIGGLWYFRGLPVKQSDTGTSPNGKVSDALIEVPKTLPAATTEEKVKSLESVVEKLVSQVNSLKSSGSQPGVTGSLDARLTDVESAVTEIKTRLSVLEQATPAPAAAVSKSPLYIPLGGSTGPWENQDWSTLTEYQATINPDNYSGYTSMQLEANFRLTEAAGTGSVRLYNVTDGSSISSQTDTTSTGFGIKTSGTFKLSGGQKTYTIQVKSSSGKQLFIQSARVKVNF